MKATCLLLSTLFASQATLACAFDSPNTSKIIESRIVFLGKVSSFQTTPTSYVSSVLIQPVQALKGGPMPIATTISGCLPPLREGQRVIVTVRGNQSYVYSAEDYEAQFKRVLAEAR